METDPDLATMIKELRQEFGLSVGATARLLGIDPSSVTKWASGQVRLTRRNREKIARLEEDLQRRRELAPQRAPLE